MRQRYSATGSGGIRNGCRYVVLDHVERDEHGGMLRVSWHRTFQQAQAEAKRRNREEQQTDLLAIPNEELDSVSPDLDAAWRRFLKRGENG